MKTIAVTGITGHTGCCFLAELNKNKYSGEVRCLVRESSNTEYLDESHLKITKVYGDIRDESAIRELLHGADTVINIANIRYTLPILKIANELSVKRMVTVHTTGIYSKYKMAADEYKSIEASVEEFLERSEVQLIILRPTMIFGDMADHNISKFIKIVDALPIIPEINHGESKIQPVNARDLGKAYYSVCTYDGVLEKDYIVSGSDAITMHQLYVLISKYLGKKRFYITIPIEIGVLVAKIVKILSFGKYDYVERVLRLAEDRNFSYENAKRDFGYLPEAFNIGLKREVSQYIEAKKK